METELALTIVIVASVLRGQNVNAPSLAPASAVAAYSPAADSNKSLARVDRLVSLRASPAFSKLCFLASERNARKQIAAFFTM